MKINELYMAALFELYAMHDNSLEGLANFMLEKSVPLSGSSIGFFGFIAEDQSMMSIHAWSEEAMKQCSISSLPG